jgi:signal transduction histidine kinase
MIYDTGIGMSPELINKLFKIEQNAHRRGTAKEGGTGLGLILTKELTELNGGTIDVSSEVGKETQFSLVF